MLFPIVASPVTFPQRLWEDSLFCTSSVVFILCRAFFFSFFFEILNINLFILIGG